MTTITLPGGWNTLLDGEPRRVLEQEVLPSYLPAQRWYMAKARRLTAVRLVESTELGSLADRAALVLIEAAYDDGPSERYFLPWVLRDDSDPSPDGSICRVEGPEGRAVLRDALTDEGSCRALLAAIAGQRTLEAQNGRFRAEPTAAFGASDSRSLDELAVSHSRAEQSNSAVRYGDRFFLKVYRHLEVGENPEVEIGRFLTERTDFANVPRTAGVITYEDRTGSTSPIALLEEFVHHDGTGWEHALTVLKTYYQRIEADPNLLPPADAEDRPLLEIAAAAPPPYVTRLVAEYLPYALQLGRRAAELHLALASDASDPAFAPEPLTQADLQQLADEIRGQVKSALATLRASMGKLDRPTASVAGRVLEESGELTEILDDLKTVASPGHKIRVHGDLHLGQVLRRGDDFLLIDFEGEPLKSLEARRAKYAPLKDVVGMIRSYDYAAYAALFDRIRDRPGAFQDLSPWAAAWQTWISAAFVRQYLATADGAPVLPADHDSLSRLLNAFTLDKTLYELQYELNNRPSWVPIPLLGVLALIERRREPSTSDDE
jgi:maltose alpha-D-glucosyltransferase/alpha-amylase